MVICWYFSHVFGVGLHKTSTHSINTPTDNIGYSFSKRKTQGIIYTIKRGSITLFIVRIIILQRSSVHQSHNHQHCHFLDDGDDQFHTIKFVYCQVEYHTVTMIQ